MTKKGNKKKEQRTVGREQADVRVFLIWPLVKKQNLKIFIDWLKDQGVGQVNFYKNYITLNTPATTTD